MRAEVISIGDELASGQSLDTNSQWLSQRLGELGVPVMFHTTVGDDMAANVLVFRQAIERADLILCSGGLGPTADDLTRQALAETAGVELVQNETALEHIRALFARRKRPMPAANEIQALLPRGGHLVPNPHGTAPGIDLEVPRAGRSPSRVFALPGVPAEMKEMWQQTVAPAIANMQGDRRCIVHRRIKCFGVGESDLEAMLPDLIRRGRTPSVGITVSKATITLRITAEGTSADECRAAMEPTAKIIYDCLGTLVYGEEDDELQHAIARRLNTRGESLAVVEQGTAGLILQWCGECPEMKDFFRGGVVVREPSVAERMAARATNTEGEDPVARLATAVRAEFSADYGLAIGPFPVADSATQTPGNLEIVLAARDGLHRMTFPFAGHPDILRSRAAKQALNFLRLRLV